MATVWLMVNLHSLLPPATFLSLPRAALHSMCLYLLGSLASLSYSLGTRTPPSSRPHRVQYLCVSDDAEKRHSATPTHSTHSRQRARRTSHGINATNVTIIIPALCDSLQTLEDFSSTLQRLQQQLREAEGEGAHPVVRVVVVDDGSIYHRDIRNISTRYGVSSVLRAGECQGAAAARNAGLSHAMKNAAIFGNPNTSLYVFLDVGMEISPTWRTTLFQISPNKEALIAGITFPSDVRNLRSRKTPLEEIIDLYHLTNGTLLPRLLYDRDAEDIVFEKLLEERTIRSSRSKEKDSPDSSSLSSGDTKCRQSRVLYAPSCNLVVPGAIARYLSFSEEFTSAGFEDVELCLRLSMAYGIPTKIKEGLECCHPFHERDLDAFCKRFERYGCYSTLLLPRFPNYYTLLEYCEPYILHTDGKLN